MSFFLVCEKFVDVNKRPRRNESQFWTTGYWVNRKRKEDLGVTCLEWDLTFHRPGTTERMPV